MPSANIPEFIKAITGDYLRSLKAVISSSSMEFVNGSDGERCYRYSSMLNSDFKTWEDTLKFSEVPGQTDKLATITSSLGEHGSKIDTAYAEWVYAHMPERPIYGSSKYRGTTLRVSAEIEITAEQAAHLRTRVPEGYSVD